MRLNKFIALSSRYSRRAAEKLILEGKIKINGEVVNKLAIQVDPKKDKVEIEEKTIQPCKEKIYIALHKPAGYICTCKDTHKRKTVLNLIDEKFKVYPIGRLDKETEGLLILTNDGELTLKLTHPRFHCPKQYLVKIDTFLTKKQTEKIKNGICLGMFKTSPAKIDKVDKGKIIKITIFEGKKRQIRRMFEALGRKVIYLRRIKIGNLALGSLPKGKYRFLSKEEVKKLTQHIC